MPDFLGSGDGRLAGVGGTEVNARGRFGREGSGEWFDRAGLAERDFMGLVNAVAGRQEVPGLRLRGVAHNHGSARFFHGERQGHEHAGNRLGQLFEARGGPTQGLLGNAAEFNAAGDGAEFEQRQGGDRVARRFGAIIVFLATEDQVG